MSPQPETLQPFLITVWNMTTHEWVKVQLYVIFTSAIHGSGWSVSAPVAYLLVFIEQKSL